MSQELVTYIVLGSKTRLKETKLPVKNKYEEYLRLNFDSKENIVKTLDDLITLSKGELIVLLPPSSFPNTQAKEALKKIALIGLSSWGWFEFSLKRKNFLQNVKKINTLIRSIPDLEQGIYFSKSLYFSVGGIGSFNTAPFSEIAKRLYSRIDPQKPLSPLIIRTKNLTLDLYNAAKS
ncbi:hypothetical protein N9I06_01140 [Gammaproteobacteria bacterium]|nr:hypothetical protein [Gammaproteobacteria bacterium]MDA9902876.1 hypothetical protein [Gammaproteobacteria bacterium]MDC0401707.1 hypothetical protein [Gammaproteobacteria bacterium]MDC1073927.1 hypothetical protein [Gammaproteobacteria bacterium]MDC6460167.1 hypothetical protein [Gammaproteobacteria bacterium]